MKRWALVAVIVLVTLSAGISCDSGEGVEEAEGGLVADFGGAHTSGMGPLTVDFQDLSTGNVSDWLWDFGDGSNSSEQNPTHTYEDVGRYDVSLTVMGGDDSDTEAKSGFVVVGQFKITDDLGRTVTLDDVPQRIVSLAPSCTEILFALGVEDRIVGVTSYCDYPEAAKAKEALGGFSTVDLEKVAAADPDLILAAGLHEEETLPALENLGYTVVALAPEGLDDVIDNVLLVGDVTGAQDQASDLAKEMRTRVDAVAAETERMSPDDKPWTFYITWHEPLWTLGSETMTNDLLVQAGGINIAHDMSGHGEMSLETLVARNPEVMVACTGHGSAVDAPFEWAKTSEILSVTNARENDRVYQVDADLVTRGGPRIVEGLEWFAHYLHPDLFDAPA